MRRSKLSHQNDKRGAIAYLILLVICINLVINYWKIIAAFIGIIVTLFILYFIITLVLEQRKIRQIRQSEVISIPSQTLYGIPMKVEKHQGETNEGEIKSQWIVMSFRPELNDNNLNFVKLNHELDKVKVIKSEPQQDSNYETTKQISSLTKEIFCEIDPQLSVFKKQDAELERLEKLISSSDLYHSKVHLYKRARIQVQQLIDQAENLKLEYCKCIREILIGAEISQFEPNTMPDILEIKLTLHSKYEALLNEFQNRKDEIDVYNELNIEISQLP